MRSPADIEAKIEADLLRWAQAQMKRIRAKGGEPHIEISTGRILVEVTYGSKLNLMAEPDFSCFTDPGRE